MAEKIKYLDGLRGVAAFIVVLWHVALIFLPAIALGAGFPAHFGDLEYWVKWSPLNILYNGNFAVYVFFVLSGYVLTQGYFAGGDNAIISSGACRRYIRLAIPVLFSVLFAYLFLKQGWLYNVRLSIATGNPWLSSFWNFTPDLFGAIHYALWDVFINSNQIYNPVLWTISSEFFGSLLVFALALLFGKLRNRWIYYLLTAILCWNTNFLPFIIGLCLADLNNSPGLEKYRLGDKRPVSKAILIALLGVAVLFGSYPYSYGPNYASGLWSLLGSGDFNLLTHTAGAALILYALLNSSLLQRIFGSKIPAYLGRISFSMYVTHLIILCSLTSFLAIALKPYLTYELLILACVGISLPIIFIVADLGARYVDQPATRFSKIVYEWLSNPRKLKNDITLHAHRIDTIDAIILAIKKR